MRKFLIPIIMVTLAVACLAAGPASTYRVQFTDDVKVGDVVLKAGDYKVIHQMQGEQHIMIFEQGKKEVAKVPCTIEKLKTKASRSEQYFETQNGVKLLKALVFSGETIQHNF
jgi:hypothetical protein